MTHIEATKEAEEKLNYMKNETINKKIFESYQLLKSFSYTPQYINLKQAKELAFMKENNNFKIVMGDPEATWRNFISQSELQPLKVDKADRLAKIYTTYINQLGLKEEDIKGIDSVSLYRLSILVNKDNVSSWLKKAKKLSRTKLWKELSKL